MVVAVLIDAYVDRQFAAKPGINDILEYRAELAAASPALGLIMALCSRRDDVRLVTEAVEVPLGNYGSLAVEDFMVSLYNNHSVQRVRIAPPDGTRHDMIDTLRGAMTALDAD